MPKSGLLKNIFNLKTFTVFSVVLLSVLAICNLVNTNLLATQGAIVNEVENNTLRLEKENKILNIKIAELSRLTDLELLAANVGFFRTSDIVFAPNNSTFALR